MLTDTDDGSRFAGLDLDDVATPAIPTAKAPINASPTADVQAPVSADDAIKAMRAVSQFEVPSFRTATTHGAEMQPRMRRCYMALASRKIGISDFSTDETCVREESKIRALLAEVTAAGESLPEHAAQRQTLRDLWVDLENLRRRADAHRARTGQRVAHALAQQAQLPNVAAQQYPTASAVPSQPNVLAALTQPTVSASGAQPQNQLVAVEGKDGGYTGRLVWTNGFTGCEAADFAAACDAEGIDAEDQPEQCSPRAAMHRAVVKATRGGRGAYFHRRSDSPKGWRIMKDGPDGEAKAVALVTLGRDVNAQPTLDVSAMPFQEVPTGMADAIKADYNRTIGQALAATDLSRWFLQHIVQKLGDGVSLRASGGNYYVRKDREAIVLKAKAALNRVGCNASTYYAMKSADLLADLGLALAKEVSEFVAGVSADIEADQMGTRKARNRIDETLELAQRAARYEAVIGQPIKLSGKTVAAVLSEAIKLLAAMTTRTSNLEVD